MIIGYSAKFVRDPPVNDSVRDLVDFDYHIFEAEFMRTVVLLG
jgi:hypothetical protein